MKTSQVVVFTYW